MRSVYAVGFVVLGTCFGASAPALGVVVAVGDAVVAEPQAGRIQLVDTLTGAQQLISSGGLLVNPIDVAFEADGKLVVTDPGAGAVIRIDPASGAQTLLSTGSLVVEPLRLVVEPNGDLVIVDAATGDGSLIRIDPSTGVQTLVASVGGGSGLVDPHAVAVAANGDLLVAEADAAVVSRVDPVSGVTTLLATSFPYLIQPAEVMDIAVEASGDLLVATTFGPPQTTAVLFRVDPVSGAQQLTPVASGAAFNGIAIEASGDVLATLPFSGVVRIDAVSGQQTPISTLLNPQGIAVRRTQCDDRMDNDGDGTVDVDDSDCWGAQDNRERPGLFCGLGFELALLLPLVRRLVHRTG